jgi:hypothetical protein
MTDCESPGCLSVQTQGDASHEGRGPVPNEAKHRFRLEMGLPTAGPVVLSGHQAAFWHPGIAAKVIAAHHIAQAWGGSAVWIVVDHDLNDTLGLRVPVVGPGGHLRTSSVELAPSNDRNLPAGSRPALTAVVPPPDERIIPLPSVRTGLERIVRAMNDHRDAPTLAHQVGHAALSLLGRHAPDTHLVVTAQMAETGVFKSLVQRMAEEPAAVAEAYNSAVATVEDHGVAPLQLSDDAIELPLWRITEEGRRERVYAEELNEVAPGTLRPRALLMTAIMRLFGCELFLHGTGGASYDRVTEEWVGRWLGDAWRERLAPRVTITATRYLPFGRDVVPPAQLERERIGLRRMLHDPAVHGEADTAERKRRLVESIDRAPRNSGRRAALFREMHAMLDEMRTRHEDSIRRQEDRVARHVAHVDEAQTVFERTWPFPYYSDDTVSSLAPDIEAQLAEQGFAI